jgi:hypothetical protein
LRAKKVALSENKLARGLNGAELAEVNKLVSSAQATSLMFLTGPNAQIDLAQVRGLKLVVDETLSFPVFLNQFETMVIHYLASASIDVDTIFKVLFSIIDRNTFEKGVLQTVQRLAKHGQTHSLSIQDRSQMHKWTEFKKLSMAECRLAIH